MRELTLVIRGGKIFTVTKGIVDEGLILIDEGKIKEVGKREDVKVPPGADVIDAKDMYILPGLIDAHTHLGVSEQAIGWEGRDTNESTDPVTPHLRAIDGVKSDDPGFQDALSSGVTTVGILPGSGNVIGGMGAALKTYGRHKLEMLVKEPIGLKIAFGENPKRVHGLENKRMPSTRMGIAGLLREWFTKTQNYVKKKEVFANQPEKLPDLDVKLEALELVIKKTIPVRAHAHMVDDILTAISLSTEFGFNIVLDHSTESHRIPDILAEYKIPAVVGPLFTSKYKVELRNRTTETPGILWKHGVKVAITTDHPVVPIKLLPLQVAVAIRDGLPFEEALRAVTINSAEILGISNRVGSIEPGKDGDIIILDGPPFTIESRVVYTIVNGEIVYSKEDKKK